MINIITTSLDGRTRGPKKVVANLIKGLEQAGYPYVINRSLDATNQLWIHDDVSALPFIKDLPSRISIIIGPNLFVNPENIPADIDLSRALYIHPSQNVIDIWKRKGYDRSALAAYPSGIDTELFTTSHETRTGVLLYVKNRAAEEQKTVEHILASKGIACTVFVYGSYKEEEFRKALATSRYAIWLGGYESQGIALLETLSCDMPVLLLEKKHSSPDEAGASCAPYWSSECGIISDLEHVDTAVTQMEQSYQKFSPREYVVGELSLKKQAQAFADLYLSHFDISTDELLEKTLLSKKTWRKGWFKKLIKKLLVW